MGLVNAKSKERRTRKTYIVVLSEETINVFQGPVGRLGVEEVDDWYKRKVEDGPDYVELPLQ